MFDCCIINIGWLTLLVYFFSHLVMLLVSYGFIMFILTHYFIIVIDSTCFDVVIVLFNYYHNMLTSSYHMILYPILGMYTLIVAYF